MSAKPLRSAGVDVGSLTAEGVLLEGDTIRATAQILARPSPLDSATEVLAALAARAGIAREDLGRVVATGYGREVLVSAGLAHENVSEISCHGFGAFCLEPAIRTVIDIGGQDAKAIRVDGSGTLESFIMNDKCAAGTGHFLELMAHTLEVDLSALGRLALRARRPVHVTSRCSAFVETEVLHFLQGGARREDVAAGVADAMAERVAALARRVSPEPAVTLTGGVAKNLAVRRRLEARLRIRILDLPLDPQLVGAFGAARLAARQRRDGTRPDRAAPDRRVQKGSAANHAAANRASRAPLVRSEAPGSAEEPSCASCPPPFHATGTGAERNTGTGGEP